MPRPSEWIQHLDRALDELNDIAAPTIDRAGIQTLFGVSARQAVRLLERLGGYKAGKSLLIERGALIHQLRRLQAEPTVQFEANRRERVRQEIARARQEARAKAIEIKADPGAWSRGISDLPSTVSLRPGALQIEFSDTQDLLRQLFELAQAISNDYSKFQLVCDPPETA